MQFPLQSAVTPSANQNCNAINVTVGQTLHPAPFSLPFWAVAVLMATVCQSAVTNKAKERHYLPKAKTFEGSNRFQSSFAREDTFGTCQQSRWRYFWDKRRKALVPESKGTWWLGVFVSIYGNTLCYTQWSTTSLQAGAPTCVVYTIDTASKSSHTSLVERNTARLAQLLFLLLHPPPQLMFLNYNVCQTEIRGLQPYCTFATVATNEAPGRECPIEESFSYSTGRD